MKNLHTKDKRTYSVSILCKLFGVTKQAYYKYDENRILEKIAQRDFVLQYIHSIREKDIGIGGTKLWHMYHRDFAKSTPIGRDRFSDIIDTYGLKVRKRIRKPRTTDSSHDLPLYPNIIKDLIPTRSNQLWVSDITYITTKMNYHDYEFCYISLIHHSDRGCQYASHQYIAMLKQFGIRVSMTESGNPKDNPQAERINNTIKNELLKGKSFNNIEEVKKAVFDSINFYNKERPHMSINMLTPEEASKCTGELQKRWKSYRLSAIKNNKGTLNNPSFCLPLNSG